MDEESDERIGMWLLATLLLGTALRVIGLGSASLWLDELFSRGAALAPSLWETIQRGSVNDMFPPLFPIISHLAVRLPGDAEAALRLPSAIAGCAALYPVFLLGRVLHSARVGVVAAALVACHWFAVAYSQEGRPYALLLLLTSVTAYFGASLIDRQRRGESTRRTLVGLGLSGLAVSYLHYIGLLFFACEALLLLVILRRDRAPLKGLLVSGGAVGVAYLPWLGIVLAQIERRVHLKTPPSLKTVVRAYADLCARHWLWVVLLLALGYWAARKLRASHAARPEPSGGAPDRSTFSARGRLLLLAAWIVLPGLIMFALSHLVVPIFTNRNMIVALPALAVLCALALSQIDHAFLRGRPWASALAVAALLFDLTLIKDYYHAEKEPFGPFVQRVLAARSAGDALWVRPSLYVAYADQYLSLSGADLRAEPVPAQMPRHPPDGIWILTRRVKPTVPPGYVVRERWHHEPDRRLPWPGMPMELLRCQRAP